ncbi:MAG: proton-conducting transporter membrane subunit [Asgard group archaeon]|nr:proton-conducting transporter membrane subunit [Asgard group archaeon]
MSVMILLIGIICLPFAGAFFALFLSQLEESIAAGGKTQDWLIFIIIFIPELILSLVLLRHLYSDFSYSIEWLPGLSFGLRLNKVSAFFVCLTAILSTAFAFFSISYMKFDRHHTSYWFFSLMILSSMMLVYLSSNLLWLFGGFEIASISAFFAISHWHRKVSDKGEEAILASNRFFLSSFFGDLLLLITLGLLAYSFGTSNITEIITNWSYPPAKLLLPTSKDTRLLINTLLVISCLIKTAQLPLFMWPLRTGVKKNDLTTAPLSSAVFLLINSIGLGGIFLLTTFFPILATNSLEMATNEVIFSSVPFQILGWSVIVSMFFVLLMIFRSANLKRILIGAVMGQIGFTLIGLSSGLELGFVGAFFHLLVAMPASFAVIISFGMVIESLRMDNITKLSGLHSQLKIVSIFSLLAIFCFSGVFPSGVFFSRDMIFESLIRSSITGSKILLGLSYLYWILLSFIMFKTYVQIFFGEEFEDFAIRSTSIISCIVCGSVLLFSFLAGFGVLFYGTPTPRFFTGLLEKQYNLEYVMFPFSNWVTPFILIGLLPLIFIGVYSLYKEPTQNWEEKIFNTKKGIIFHNILINGLYIEDGLEVFVKKPAPIISKIFSGVKMKSPIINIFLIVFSIIILFGLMIFLGGN